MTHEKFAEVLRELENQGTETLITKNAKYSSPDDALHNFKEGGEIGGCTSAQACWGYMTKHLVALRDKVQRNDFSDKEDTLEKIQDSINYLKFIWAIANESDKNEENIKINDLFQEESSSTLENCYHCLYSSRKASQEPCANCSNNCSSESDVNHFKNVNLFNPKNN